jgi:hypothetical protein
MVFMADAEAFGLSGRINRREKVTGTPTEECRFSIGTSVRVQDHWRSPLAGQSGRIAGISPRDACGPYLVRFANGLQFRYREDELIALTS